MKKRLLVCAYGAGHVRAVLPVIKLARAQQEFEVHVLGLTTAGLTLAKEGIPYLGFRDFADPDRDQEALAKGASLLHGAGPSLLPEDESRAYLGLSYADLADRLGEVEAARRYQEHGRAAFLPLGVLERVFDRIQPDVLLATNSPRAEEAAVRVARRRGIPSVVIVDLFGLGADLARLKDPEYANDICVLNEKVRKHLIAEGRHPASLHVTGNPAFDALLDPALSERGRSLRAARGWEGQKVVLYASGTDSRDPELPRRIESRLLEITAAHPGWHLVLRPHPNEHLHYPDLPPHTSMSGREDELAVLLHAVDAVVVTISTVGLEAAIAGTPLVSCDFSSWSYAVPYSRMGLSIGAASLQELDSALERALQETSCSRRAPFEPAGPKVFECVLRRIRDATPGGP